MEIHQFFLQDKYRTRMITPKKGQTVITICQEAKYSRNTRNNKDDNIHKSEALKR